MSEDKSVFEKYLPHGVAAVGVAIALVSYQQSSELSVADYAERIRSNELSIQNSTEQLKTATGELQAISTRIEALGRGANQEDLLQRLSDVQERLATLEAAPVGSGGRAPTAEEVAAVLVRDYAAQLTGPAGPQGQKGDKGDTGPQGAAGAGGGGGDPTRPITISADFTTDYPAQFWPWTKVDLLGCKNGSKVTCSFLATPSEDFQLGTRPSEQRIALTDGTWIAGGAITINNYRDSNWASATLSEGIPTKFDVEFLTQDSGDGVLALELHMKGKKISWKNVAYSN